MKINIDNSLYNLLQQEGMERGYTTTQEFITHVLEKQIIREIDKQLVKERLQGLGYV